MGACIGTGWGRGVVVAVLLALAGQGLAAEKSKVHGRVLDAGGRPVEGAEVYLVDPQPFEPTVLVTGKTDKAGAFEFLAEVPKDPYAPPVYCQTLVAKKGLASERVVPGKECEVRLRASTRITLTMLGPDHQPVA